MNNEANMMRDANLQYALEEIDTLLDEMGGRNSLNTEIVRGVYEAKADEWGKNDSDLVEMIMDKAPAIQKAAKVAKKAVKKTVKKAVAKPTLRSIIAGLPATAGAGMPMSMYKKYLRACQNNPNFVDELEQAGRNNTIRAFGKDFFNSNYRNVALRGDLGEAAKYQAEHNRNNINNSRNNRNNSRRRTSRKTRRKVK